MDQLKKDFLTAANTPNVLKKVDAAIKEVDLEKRLLEGEEIIGGLIVKVGSKMIDTSIANKINKLKIAMKGA